MEARTYKVYRFRELTEEAKEKAITRWYEDEDYPFLSDDLTESLKELLEQNKVKFDNDLRLFCRLGYSQGDGLCFIGNFIYKKKEYKVTHNYRYYFSRSADIEEITKEGEEIYLRIRDNESHPFVKVYLKICRELEKEGYSILEYRMDNKEFDEHCEANDYFFTADGNID